MGSKKNRFSVVFGSNLGMLAAILFLVATGITLVNTFISLFNGGFAAITGILQLIFVVIPLVLIGVGLLLLYLNGKNDEINPSHISTTKVGIMVRGILNFLGMLLVTIIVVIVVFGIIGTTFDFMSGGQKALVLIVSLLLVAICVTITTLTLMYTLRLSTLLNVIRDYEIKNIALSTKFLRVVTILLIVRGVVGVIGNILTMAMTAAVSEALEYLSMFGDESAQILQMFMGSGSNVAMIFDTITNLCFIAFNVVLIMIFSKIEYISNVAVQQTAREEENQVQEKYEEEPEEINTVQLQNQIENVNYNDMTSQNTVLIDQSVFNRGSITALSGREKGYVYPIDEGEEYIIGKDPREASIVVDASYDSVSRKHCGIKFNAKDNNYMVIDYSTNGTYINSIRKLNSGIYVTVPRGTVINLAKENLDYKLD